MSAVYAHSDHGTEQAAQAEAAKIPGAVVKFHKLRNRWDVLTAAPADGCNIISFRELAPDERETRDALDRLQDKLAAKDFEDHVRENPNAVQRADVFAGPLKPREYVIKGIQPVGAELCVIYGDSGAGKSFLIDDMLTDVHLGRPWNGRRTLKQRVVRIVAEGASDDRYRRHAIAAAKGVGLADLPRVINNAPDLFDAKQARNVAEHIRGAGGCDVLLVDTLAATFSGDENGSEMGGYIRNVKLIQRALGCTVWLVHHTGHANKDRMRGWSGLRAAADVELEVTRDGEARCVRVTKSKGGVDGARIGFKLDFVMLGRDADGDPFGSCRVEYTDAPPAAAKGPTGQKRDALEAVKAAVRESGPLEYEDARLVVVDVLPVPEPGKRDRRPGRAGELLKELELDTLLYLLPDGRLSDTRLIATANDPGF